MARVLRRSKGLLLWAMLAGPLLWGFLLTARHILARDPGEVEVYRGERVVARQALVKFAETLSSEREALLLYVTDADEYRPVGGAGWFLIQSRSKTAAQLLETASSFPEIASAEPNVIMQLMTLPNDPSFPNQWALQNTGQVIGGQPGTPGADIKAVAAWDRSTGSSNYVVGVLDTGIDYNHQDLAGNIWCAPQQFTVTVGGKQITCAAGTHGFNAINNTCDPLDDNGHGTHVSGIVGAVGNNGVGVTGVNWVTRVMGLKGCNAVGGCDRAKTIDAIEFAIQAKLTVGARVKVLNASYGCGDTNCAGCSSSDAERDEINRAYNYGIVFVAAAGNGGCNNDSTSVYPANYDVRNILAVAATDNRDNLASFSDYGAVNVDLGAPGVGILSTIPGSSYAFWDGTSMAAPHVSGAVPLIRSICALNGYAIRQTILNTVDQVPGLSGKVATGGRLNLDRALWSCTTGTPGSTSNAMVKYRVCPPFPSWPDQGYAKVTVDGVTYTTSWNRNDTPRTIADRLASLVNFDTEGTTTATVANVSSSCSGKYNARLTLTARAKGPVTNYTYYLTLVDQPPSGCYACPYFSVAPTAVSYFSGGSN